MGHVGLPACIVAPVAIVLCSGACGHLVLCLAGTLCCVGVLVGCMVLCGCMSWRVSSDPVVTRSVLPFPVVSFRVWCVFWHVVSWSCGVALGTVPCAVAAFCVLACPAGVRLVGWCRAVLLGSCGFRVLFCRVFLCCVLVRGVMFCCVVSRYVSVRRVVSWCGGLGGVALCGALRYMVVCDVVLSGAVSHLLVCCLAVLCCLISCRVPLRCSVL